MAIFSGPGKPANADEYLEQFVKEMTTLLNNGITIERHYNIKIKCFVTHLLGVLSNALQVMEVFIIVKGAM